MNLQRYSPKQGILTGYSGCLNERQSGPLIMVDNLREVINRIENEHIGDYQGRWEHLLKMIDDDDIDIGEDD